MLNKAMMEYYYYILKFDCENRKHNDEFVRLLKEDIRNTHKIMNDQLKEKPNVIEKSFDNWTNVYRFECDKKVNLKDIEETYTINYRPTPYDCTGQQFTGRVKAWQIGNIITIKQSVLMDI